MRCGGDRDGKAWLAIGAISCLPLASCVEWNACEWNTNGSEKVLLSAPGASLTCNGTAEDATDLEAFYGNTVHADATALDNPFVLHVWVQTGSLRQFFSITGAVQDGSFSLPEKDGRVVVGNGQGAATGTFSFKRSHNVPFLEIQDPEEDEVYQSVIDMDFDLVITRFVEDHTDDVDRGCVLTTGRQQVRLVQKGPVTTCRHLPESHNSHPG